jgi:hypothetical protein
LSYETSLIYSLDLNEKARLLPFIGYSMLNENSGVGDVFSRYKSNCIHGGVSAGYTFDNFMPKIGINVKRIFSRYYLYKITQDGQEIKKKEFEQAELSSRILYQMALGLDYNFKKFSIGVEGCFGLNYLESTTFFYPLKLNEYLISCTYYPFKKTQNIK